MNGIQKLLAQPVFWFVLALVVRLLYLIEQSRTSVLFYQPILDEAELMQTAQNLAAGKGFGPEPLFKAPLYPIFLAGCMKAGGMSWFWLVRFIQHLGGALLVVMGFDCARRLAGTKPSAWIAGAVTAGLLTFYAPLIRLENRMVLDFMVVFLQSAMLWALVREYTAPETSKRQGWLLLAGALAALSWLNRPTLTLVLPLLALYAGWFLRYNRDTTWRQNILPALGRSLIFLILPALAMGAVYLRNTHVGKEAMLLPWQGGYSFYHANRPGASGRYFKQQEFSMSDTGNPTYDLMIEGYQSAVNAGTAEPPQDNRFYHAVNSYWLNKSKDVIRADIPRWITLMIQKAFYLASAREIYNFEAFEIHRERSALLRLLPFNFGWLWPMAAASLALLAYTSRDQRPLLGLLWMYLILLGGAIALYYTSGRLRMPLVFPAVILAGFLVQGLIQHRPWLNRMPSFIYLAAFFALGVLMSWGNWWGVRSEVVAYYDWARLSDAAWQQGEYQAALEHVEQAETIMPNYPVLPSLKGQALFSLGRVDEAEQAFIQALDQMPGDATPAFNLGFIRYYHRNDPPGAIEFFKQAVQREPDNHKANWYAALSHLRLGDTDAARTLLQPYIDSPQQRPPMLQVAVISLLHKEGDLEQARANYREWIRTEAAEISEQANQEFELLGLKAADDLY